MSIMTQAIVAEKFGLRLTLEQLGLCIGISRATIYNQISRGDFNIPTYVENGKRWCDYRDVASYLDACRDRAKTQV